MPTQIIGHSLWEFNNFNFTLRKITQLMYVSFDPKVLYSVIIVLTVVTVSLHKLVGAHEYDFMKLVLY